jgi:hypothetical protein
LAVVVIALAAASSAASQATKDGSGVARWLQESRDTVAPHGYRSDRDGNPILWAKS